MKKLHIKTLSQVLQTGLGLFLVTGLTGCTDKDCEDLQYAPKWHVDECKKEQTTTSSVGGSHSPSTSSGYFLLMSNHGSSYSSSSPSSHSSGG